MSIIKIDLDKCVGCNECIRACPAKESNVAHFSENNDRIVIDINDDSCIKCGSCVSHCVHGARYFQDDTEQFIHDLGTDSNTALIVAPAVKNAFDGYWRHVLDWFKKKGVSKIFDVSFGADICTWAHIKYMKKKPSAKVISQPCAAIVNYVIKHNHKLIDSLSPIHSPMMCTAIYLKKYAHFSGKIAVLSPCIAKKDEFILNDNYVKYNVTFEHLKKYFEEHNITFPRKEYSNFEFDSEKSYGGAIYPMPGGLKENLLYHVPNLSVINSEGINKVYKDLDAYANTKKDQLPSVFDVLNCEFGCNGGSAIGTDYNYFETSKLMHDVKQYNEKQAQNDCNKSGNFNQFTDFKKNIDIKDFLTNYKPINLNLEQVTESDIEKIFKELGKTTKQDKNFNCHSCGYDTCRDMAIAIARGLNVPENCQRYIGEKLKAEKEKMSTINNKIQLATDTLNSIVANLHENIDSASSKVAEIASNSKENISDINKVNKAIEELSNFNSTILDMTENINQNIKGYQKMTKDVTSIAKSINLLSLNASIESARAGEAGKGFAVVATNIRELSDSTKESLESAQENETVITESVQKVYDTVNVFSEQLEGLSKQIRQTGDNISSSITVNENITTALKSLSNTSSKVSTVLEDILEILSII